MKKILNIALLLGVIMGGTLILSDLARADDRVTVTGLATGSSVTQVSQDNRASDSSCATASGSAGAQVTREPNALTIVGVGSGAAGVDTQRIQGSTTGSGLVMLRISWGSGNRSGVSSPTASRDSRGVASDRSRGVASPPGAPEMPGDVMFGSGFLVLGFGLLLYRRRVW
ncbi:MAG: hypothetical protein HYY61_02425 [Deltaproteobacteria bacterium]|nr:hypothetical protein [Deltaproteobacteria bacterium]